MRLTISLFLLLSSLLASHISAEENPYLLTEKTWKALSDINKLLAEGQASEAATQLEALIPKVISNTYDHAVTQQTLGYAYSRLEAYPNAIQAFRAALADNALPPDVSHQIRFNLAQMLIYTQEYQAGLTQLERWFQQESQPGLDAYMLAGSAYYETKQYQQAISYAKNVISLQANFDETWHQLLLSCYFKTDQYSSATQLLEKMIRFQPNKKGYWQQLLAAWQNSGNDQKTLATLQLMHKKSLLQTNEIKQLINMYLYLDMPFQAATLLENEMQRGQLQGDRENIKWLGKIWLQANERKKAARTLASLADSSGNGKLHAEVGQIYFDLRDFPNTVAHLQKALDQGGLEQTSHSYLLLGIAAFNSQNLTLAESAFIQASNASSTRDQANWWLDRIHDESQDKPDTAPSPQ